MLKMCYFIICQPIMIMDITKVSELHILTQNNSIFVCAIRLLF